MTTSRARRLGIGPVVFAAFLALAAAALALCLGPASIGPGEVLDVLGGGGDGVARAIVLQERLPTVFAGLLVGAALGVAGVLLQALLRNDLAEPYLVGVGPGAYLGVTVAALLAGASALPAALPRSIAALVGALAVSVLVFSLARRGRGTGPTLLLVGVAIGAFVSAVATAALYVAVPEWHRVVYWLLGHLAPRPALDLLLLGGALLVTGAAAVVRGRELDAVALGEDGAFFVGVDVGRLTVVFGLAASLLAALAVSVSGLIGFIGLLVPHLARGLVGPGHRRLVPTAALLGGGLLVLADGVARSIQPPLQLPVGVVTAALGAPFLVWVLLRGRA